MIILKNNTIRCKKLVTIVSSWKNVTRPFYFRYDTTLSSTRKNCCEFLASNDIILQSDHQSYSNTLVLWSFSVAWYVYAFNKCVFSTSYYLLHRNMLASIIEYHNRFLNVYFSFYLLSQIRCWPLHGGFQLATSLEFRPFVHEADILLTGYHGAFCHFLLN